MLLQPLRLAFLSVLLLGIAVLGGCKKEESPGTEPESPVLYRLSTAPVYLYTDSDLRNNSYWVEGGSVVPVCGRSEKAYELCPKGSAKPLFVRVDQAAPLGSRDYRWDITHLRVDAEGAGIALKPSTEDTNIADKPAVWFDGTGEDQVDAWVTPARCATLMTFVPSAESANYSVACRQEDSFRSRLSIHWDRILGIAPEWRFPLRLDLKFKGKVASPPLVVLDPGHGFSEPGMQWGDRFEKDLSVEAAGLLKSKLESDGVRVLLTRSEDTPPPPEGALSLFQRTNLAAEHGADLFVSLHFDNWQTSLVLPSPPSGLNCYYQHWFSAPFAGGLCREAGRRGWQTSWVVRRELGVLGSYRFPSVLLELANIASSEDSALVADRTRFAKYLSDIAASIEELVRSPAPR